ncbi:MAG: hypothetical protein ACI9NT_000090 [Bacteroidia bacterium]|jgi:hypothetical protein
MPLGQAAFFHSPPPENIPVLCFLTCNTNEFLLIEQTSSALRANWYFGCGFDSTALKFTPHDQMLNQQDAIAEKRVKLLVGDSLFFLTRILQPMLNYTVNAMQKQ